LWLKKAEDNAIKAKHKLNQASKDSKDRIKLLELQNKSISDMDYSRIYLERYSLATKTLQNINAIEKIDDEFLVIRNTKISTIILENLDEDEAKLKKMIEQISSGTNSSIIVEDDEIFEEIKKIQDTNPSPSQILQRGLNKKVTPSGTETKKRKPLRKRIDSPQAIVSERMDNITKKKDNEDTE
jgi:hypothetical protein